MEEETVTVLTKDANDEKQEKLVNWGTTKYETAKTGKNFFEEEMKEDYKLYKGDHWDVLGPNGDKIRSQKGKATRSNSVDNHVFSSIEGLVSEFSILPKIVFKPTEPGDDDNANALTELTSFILDKNKFDKEVRKANGNFFRYGPMIFQVYWDPAWTGGKGGNRWVGDIRVKAVHPSLIFVDPRAKDDIQDGEYVIKAVPRTLEYIRNNYEKGKYVTGDDSLFTDIEFLDEEATSAGESFEKRVLLLEIWYKGEPKYLEEGEVNQGRGLHVLTIAGGVFLSHKAYIYDHGQLPFIWRNCYEREESIWGFGDILQIKNPQVILNKVDETILEGNMHQTFGQTFYAKGALNPSQKKAVQKYGTLPNQYFEANSPDLIKRVHGQGVPASVYNYRTIKQQSIESTTGRYDVTQGRLPSREVSGSALIEINSRATARQKSKKEVQESCYKEVGEHISWLISQFYTTKRGYRILGPNGEYEYKDFTAEQLKKVYIFSDSENGIPDATYRKQEFQEMFGKPPQRTLSQGAEPIPLEEDVHYEEYTPDFDTYATVDVEQITSRSYNMELAKELFAIGAINIKVLYHVIEHGQFPPWAEVRAELENMQPRGQVSGQVEQQRAQEGYNKMAVPKESRQEGSPQGGQGQGVPSLQGGGQAQEMPPPQGGQPDIPQFSNELENLLNQPEFAEIRDQLISSGATEEEIWNAIRGGGTSPA